jgi:hypothetical protein
MRREAVQHNPTLLELDNDIFKRLEFLDVNELELLNEEVEVLEAGVQMSLGLNGHDIGHVCRVDMGIHTEESSEHGRHLLLEVARERLAVLKREDRLIVDL